MVKFGVYIKKLKSRSTTYTIFLFISQHTVHAMQAHISGSMEGSLLS